MLRFPLSLPRFDTQQNLHFSIPFDILFHSSAAIISKSGTVGTGRNSTKVQCPSHCLCSYRVLEASPLAEESINVEVIDEIKCVDASPGDIYYSQA